MIKKVIGITGSIGSGKSTVSSHLKQMGYQVIDCDKISHMMLLKNRKGYKQVLNEFGTMILDEEAHIDRKKLGAIIFNDTSKREKLNQILHPLIKEKVKSEIEKSSDTLVFMDCPLLFETDFHMLCDFSLVVYVDYDSQIRRIMKRDGIDFPTAIRKINAQMPMEEKIKKADLVIDNSHSESDLDWQISQILFKLN